MIRIKNNRAPLVATLSLAALGLAVVDGCSFDDRDLEQRPAFANSCEFSFDDICDEGGLCDDGTDTADCEGSGDGDVGDGDVGDGDGDLGDGDGDGIGGMGGGDPGGPNSCEGAKNGSCEEGMDCAVGTDRADCFEVSGDDLCNDYSPNGICEVGTGDPEDQLDNGCAYGADTTDCDNLGGLDTCNLANDGLCDEPFDCEPGTDYSDCSVLTASNSCFYLWNALDFAYFNCTGDYATLEQCEPELDDQILDVFGCAHEALVASCADLEGLRLGGFCGQLIEQNVIDYF